MILDQEMNLFRSLLEKTAKGQIKWKAGVKEGVYRVDFTASSVEIGLLERKGTTDVFMSIRDAQGNLVQEVTDVAFANASGQDAADWYEAMYDLYDGARKSVLGTDQIISSILKELESDGE